MALRKIAKLPLRHNTFASILIGLSMGIALSLVITPLIDEECAGAFQDHFSGGRSLQSEAVAVAADALSDAEDYEPRVLSNLPVKPQSAETGSKPLIRPRFYSTELGIKEKLFVGILSDSETVETNGMAVNATLAHHVDKLVFFVDGAVPKKLSISQSVVGLTEETKSSHPYRAIAHIGEHFINDYDYFFLAPDNVYVRGMKLKLMVSGISVGQLVYMGHTGNKGAGSCDLQRGILFSQQVLRSMLRELDWCKQNLGSEDVDSIGTCVLHSVGLSCSSTVQGNSFAAFNLGDSFSFDKDMSVVGKQSEFTSALTLFPVTTQETFYKLHLHYTLLDLKETEKEISNLQSNIVSINQYLPPEMQSNSWPIGVSPPSKAKDRFSVIQWDYLTKTHVYPDSDFSSVRPLTSLEKQDLDEILSASLAQLGIPDIRRNSDAVELINCYRRFDPARGMEYILDISLKDPASGSVTVKRMEAIRSLGKVEMIPVPYVTENTRLVLLVPISDTEQSNAVRFLKDFAEVCLEKNDNAVLVLMFINGKQSGSKTEDNFAALKGLINTYNNKYQTEGAKVSWISVKNVEVQPATFGVLDLITKKFPAETLFVACHSGMEIRTEFLNRARMNTIQGWQVFFPIPFSQYNPDIVFSKEKSRPTTIEVNKIHGHFDAHDFDVFSFYNADYQSGRKLMEKHIPIVRSERDLKDTRHHAKTGHNLFEMFLNMKSVHVMRAVEPYLRIRFQTKFCQESLNPKTYEHCLASSAEGLASRSQLASLVFQYERNLT